MTPTKQTTSVFLAVGRVFWMMIGPLLLAGLAFSIAQRGNGWWTPLDIAFLAVLVGLIVARWIEFRGDSPQTSDGRAATPADLRRYVLGVVIVGLSIWAIANVVGNHWLTP